MSDPYVYAITDRTSIKIGVSTRPVNRMKTLLTGNANNLYLLGYFPGGYELEKEIHNRFTKVRANGEWMHATAELIDYLNLMITDKFIIVENNQVLSYRKIPN